MLLEQLRRAMKKSGQTRYAISKASGVDQTVLHRIAHGGGCSVETLDILCKYLGLELRPKTKKRAR